MPQKRINRLEVLEKARACFTGDRSPTMDEVAAGTGISRAALFKLFGSRAAMMEELGLAPGSSARERITAAAAELLAEVGLARLSMDDVATRAEVSRATVYRLFPGKSALYLELLRTYTPLDETAALVRRMSDRPPAEVMPALALTVARSGSLRLAVLRSLLVETSVDAPDTSEAVAHQLRTMRPLIGYIAAAMSAGQLRQMDPVLALQAFTGPIMFHLLTRRVLAARLRHTVPVEEAVTELSWSWLRAMAPPAAPNSDA